MTTISANPKDLRSTKQGSNQQVLHLFVLCAFALAQPIFELLAKHPEFFIVRRSQFMDLWILVVTLLLPLPILCAGVVTLAKKFSATAGTISFLVLMGLLFCVITLPLWKAMDTWPDSLIWLCALFSGTFFALCYHIRPPVRHFVSLASVALLLFPGLFLYQTHTLFATQDQLPATEANSETPVTILILDELSSTTLMDPSQNIDAIRYPNLAALAAQSHWFRNATTVADSTTAAVPVIFTGRFPGPDKRMPNSSQMPQNLFSFLHRSHVINAVESVTWLRHSQICSEEPDTIIERLSSLAQDVGYIYLQIILPRDTAARFPAVTQTWANFNASSPVDVFNEADMGDAILKASLTDDTKTFSAFIASIVTPLPSASKPVANIMHIVFPHIPYQHLPSGKKYNSKGAEPGLSTFTGAWSNDEWAVRQHYQRYLLQLQYVDTLIGRLLQKLKDTHLYDPSLIVLASDHGASFRADTFRRRLTRENYADILPVVFLAKLPFQNEAHVTDHNVETIDILPTLADALGLPLPFPVDGHSALNTHLPARETKRALRADTGEVMQFEPNMAAKYKRLSWQLDMFGHGSDDVFTHGPLQHLVGTPLANLPIQKDSNVSLVIDNTASYKKVNTGHRKIPARVTGQVEPPSLERPAYIAIGVNGLVRAITKTHSKQQGKIRFTAMLPASALKDGENVVEAILLPAESLPSQ